MGFIEEQQLESAYVMGTYARKPVELVRGRGMQVEDSEGRTYLDFVSGVGAVSLGHCHPALVSAIEEQASTLVHVSNYYYIEHRGEVAHLVSDLLNECVDEGERTPWQSFFANSGAEANECAFKLARLHAKKRAMAAAEAAGADEDGVRAAAAAAPRLIVTLDASFHGRTLATLAATAQPAKQEAFQPLPDGFVRTPINDIKALESLFASQGDGICAVMVECVQGESGVHPCTAEFLAAVRRLTAECGALFMCDEIQCGMYRCGTHPFGFQHFGVTPDVVTIAKGIASGFPMGMCAARAQVAASFDPGDHGSTFGGSCLAVAAAEATVRALAAEDAAGNAERTGAYLREKLTALPQVEEVRGLGLMVACDLAEGVSAPDVVLAGLDEGLLLNFTGPRTLRFLPPLVCSKEDVDVLVQKLAALLS
ncbi:MULTISPECIES: aminotransferase class III-fold pyridoxal phosphate-dependent enzyme [Eggerthella]|uniref:aminotransferase class III-fold pyridoxal phosphate-dependent enzyme n=1 Tax=Eggerthella TaxID=84111 RepID=UPI000DF805E4|nr:MULTISPECIES: aminotransferase class III-fold pyridoxal phosphate-dependent enzyme [Eggerthella]MDB1769625.1 aminotransferase class III-fold pyridoxal phosphate-dependent enzyme [Eggerthella lenta]MZJ94335.1 aminotransferase class III-fold pyridoxal phosphate-dependent enzyme [Eggerthella sp. BIOML-A3]MZJ99275.1 aminotransferase class III-fold pyridoxal phosphate-dependent enzyme [Eggerthella sp. BIOML-A1]MZK35615.1 aminotransferase class III-fold pyridoxal phosphate-dependent enzyme [Eggert